MNYFDNQTIQDLEFNLIREQLTEFCTSETAKKRMSALAPIDSEKRCKQELFCANELLTIKKLGETFPHIEFEELQAEIKLLKIKNSVIQQEGFMRLYRASMLVNDLIYFFNKRYNF